MFWRVCKGMVQAPWESEEHSSKSMLQSPSEREESSIKSVLQVILES